jgi:hypothetical protein
MHEAKLGMDQVMIQVQALAFLITQFDLMLRMVFPYLVSAT